MEKENAEHQIGHATYEIHRVFAGEKTSQQVVIEEIITAAGGQLSFDHSGREMV